MIEGRVAGERCILMQPMTYMNRSGLAVGEAVSFYKLDVSEVLVVVDDLYLPLGKVRLRGEGSAGGHNGLSDIERSLGTRGYARLRIGIGAAGSENSEAGDGSARISQKDYVLGKFSQEEQEQLPAVLDRACDCIESWLREGLDKAMSRFNTDDGPLRGTR